MSDNATLRATVKVLRRMADKDGPTATFTSVAIADLCQIALTIETVLARIAELEVFESLSRTLDASNTRMAEQLRELEAEREHAVYAYVSTRIAELEAAVLAEREACVMLVLSDQFDDIDSLAAAIRARPAP